MIDLLENALKVSIIVFCLYVGYRLLPMIISLFCKPKKDLINWGVIGIKNKADEIPILLKATNSTYLYQLPDGISVKDVVSKQDKLESTLKTRLEITRTKDYLCEIKRITSKYEKVYKVNFKTDLIDGMRFNIGKRLDGSDMILDMTGSECHTLVCGSTGSGKSVFLNVLVSQLVLKQVELHIVDFKRVEYVLYSDYYNLKSLDYTEAQCEKTLKHLVDLMDSRYKKLSVAKCKNYSDYNKKHPTETIKPVVLLIDEFSVINQKSNSYKYLFDLLARARACNIIIILATQRPDSKVISGSLKCNLKNTIVFKVENEVDSEVALSQKGNYRAFRIKENGVGLLKSKGEIIEFKGYYMNDSEIEKAIKPILTKKKPIKPVKSKVNPIKKQNVESKTTIKVLNSDSDIKNIDLL